MSMQTLTYSDTMTYDRQALAAIYERHSPELFRYAYRLLGDSDLAEDCVAETFSRFLRVTRDGSSPMENVRAYLYRVAHNWVTDHYRRQPLPPLSLEADMHSDPEANPSRLVADQMDREQVRAALLRLPAEQRQVIELRFLEEWPHEAVAAAVGKSVEATARLAAPGVGRFAPDVAGVWRIGKMSDVMNNHEIDPEMKELLDLLRPVPERTPEAIAAGRSKFVAELDALYPVEQRTRKGLWASVLVNIRLLKENFGMKNLVFRTMVAILAVLVLVLGGAGVTAQAAAGALPGDALYGVKTGLEQARLSLTGAADAQVRLYLELANRRLEEMDALVDAGRFTEIAPLADDFHKNVGKALEALKAAAQENPATAADLNAEIAASLARFSQMLNSIVSRVPETAQPALLPALQAAQGSDPAVGNENANGNSNDDNSNGNANGNSNDDNSNGNTNGNSNDDNSNGNTNGNSNDDNSNGNTNGNSNDDNSNGNTNGNSNDDNSNGNANGNSNDDNSNDNANGNSNDDNSNDNGGGGNDNGGGGNDDGGGGGGNDDGGGGGGGNDDGGGGKDDGGGSSNGND